MHRETEPASGKPAGAGPSGASGRGSPPRRPLPPQRLVRLALLLYGGLVVAALAWRTGLGGEPILYASAAGAVRGVRLLPDAASGLAVAAGVILASRALARRTRTGEALSQALARALGPLSPSQVVLLALASGIGEEAFFRGALQPRVGLAAASLLFALAHLVPTRAMAPWSVFALGAGLLLGALFEATGNLLAPVLAHVAINAVNLRLLVQEYGGRGGVAHFGSRN